MSLEILEKLEKKIQQAIDTIILLNMEIEELKEKNGELSKEIQICRDNYTKIELEKNKLYEQYNNWQERLQNILGRMEEV